MWWASILWYILLRTVNASVINYLWAKKRLSCVHVTTKLWRLEIAFQLLQRGINRDITRPLSDVTILSYAKKPLKLRKTTNLHRSGPSLIFFFVYIFGRYHVVKSQSVAFLLVTWPADLTSQPVPHVSQPISSLDFCALLKVNKATGNKKVKTTGNNYTKWCCYYLVPFIQCIHSG